MRNIDETTIKKVITAIGIDRLLESVPQSDLLPALGLVSMRNLSQMMGMNYSTVRWHVKQERIPRPTIRLKRRSYYRKTEAEAIAQAWREKKFSWRKDGKVGQ